MVEGMKAFEKQQFWLGNETNCKMPTLDNKSRCKKLRYQNEKAPAVDCGG
jgi:hypothetical protein